MNEQEINSDKSPDYKKWYQEEAGKRYELERMVEKLKELIRLQAAYIALN